MPPTPPQQDLAVPPNKAQTARRRVQVVCSGSEFICPQNDDGSLSCSYGGICGLKVVGPAVTSSSSALTSASATQQGSGSSAKGGATIPSILSQTASSSTSPSSSSSSGAGATATPIIPIITLLGPSTVTVSAGMPYAKCQTGLVSGCDQVGSGWIPSGILDIFDS